MTTLRQLRNGTQNRVESLNAPKVGRSVEWWKGSGPLVGDWQVVVSDTHTPQAHRHTHTMGLSEKARKGGLAPD
jgi:hypothetical protein